MDLSYQCVSNGGERVVHGDRDALLREHVDRYEFARERIAKGSLVLDAACGSGYGTELLAQHAQSVKGMDLSPVAIAYCEKQYRLANASFLQGSVEALPFPDESFDAFVSFETIEHIPHPEKLISEAWRVLRPNGLFLVSTPNRVLSGLASGERPSNPYHLFEWSFSEFHSALKINFSQIAYFGQRIRGWNKCHPLYIASKWKRFRKENDIVALKNPEAIAPQLENLAAWQPTCFIAVCQKSGQK